MISITEEKKNGNSFYIKRIGDAVQILDYARRETVLDGYKYIYLIDHNERIVQSIFRYSNIEKRNDNESERDQLISAIRILSIFSEFIDQKVVEFDDNDWKAFSYFLRGISCDGFQYKMDLITRRSSATCNVYFSHIRGYLRYIGAPDNDFLKSTVVRLEGGTVGKYGFSKKQSHIKYKYSLSGDQNSYRPEGITIEQFRNLIFCNREIGGPFAFRNEIILILLYCYGLRIGEILGMTIEDLHEEERTGPFIILTNRETDKKQQHSKGLYSGYYEVSCRGVERNDTDSRWESKIYMDPVHFRMINDYLKESRDVFGHTPKFCSNVLSVTATALNSDGKNQYVFLSKNGTPLSYSGWNKTIRNLFTCAGIPVDYKTKRNNTSHRLRSGTATYLIDDLGLGSRDVQKYMRHRSASSIEPYYRPTEERVRELHDKIHFDIKKKMDGNN
jgi:integrase/recombinase XerD